MELKARFLKWSAGFPVAMLNSKTATELGVHTKDRVSLQKKHKPKESFSTIVDIVQDIVNPGEIALSSEVKEVLNIKDREKIDVVLAPSSTTLIYIKKKLSGKKLSKKEIFEIIENTVDNSLSEIEISLFLSGLNVHGMTFKEILFLIEAFLTFGNPLDLRNRIIIDKHSTGGVAGNRTTPIVVSICSSLGLVFPKTSSRAITSAAGTADVLEAITNVELSRKKLLEVLKKTNACMIWGGGLNMVPADSKLIKIEKLLNIDLEPLLLASVFSKKLAVGSNCILIDIPFGPDAKLDKKTAKRIGRKFKKLGKHFKRKVKCVLTDGNFPIGRGIGPMLELNDVISVLDPTKRGPEDLREKALMLSGKLLEMSGKVKKGQGKIVARKVLDSGLAFKKFNQIIDAQGRKKLKLKLAKYGKHIIAKKAGSVSQMHNKKINMLARILGCPIDKAAGVLLNCNHSDSVEKGQIIMTLFAESKERIKQAEEFIEKEKPFKIV